METQRDIFWSRFHDGAAFGALAGGGFGGSIVLASPVQCKYRRALVIIVPATILASFFGGLMTVDTRGNSNSSKEQNSE